MVHATSSTCACVCVRVSTLLASLPPSQLGPGILLLQFLLSNRLQVHDVWPVSYAQAPGPGVHGSKGRVLTHPRTTEHLWWVTHPHTHPSQPHALTPSRPHLDGPVNHSAGHVGCCYLDGRNLATEQRGGITGSGEG